MHRKQSAVRYVGGCLDCKASAGSSDQQWQCTSGNGLLRLCQLSQQLPSQGGCCSGHAMELWMAAHGTAVLHQERYKHIKDAVMGLGFIIPTRRGAAVQ